MRISRVTTTTVAILVGAAIAPVVPAAAQNAGPAAPDQVGSAVETAHHDQIVLRRDGESAVPFDPVIGTGDEPALRRDGSKAEPFVAEVGPQAGATGDGFDWGDAMVGAGIAYGLMLLAAGALLLIRRRIPRLALASGRVKRLTSAGG